MRRIRTLRDLLEYGLLIAALVPTLLILLAAVACFADGGGPAVVTMPAIPIYSAS